MKRKTSVQQSELWRLLWVGFVLTCVVFSMVFVSRRSSANDGTSDEQSLSPMDDPNLPREFDLRAIHGTPRGTDLPVPGLPSPTLMQVKALNALRNRLGLTAGDALLQVNYNGLTATPRHIARQDGFLSAPSALPAETVALDFIRQNREIFRFDETDLSNLKLISRAVSANGTTTLIYNQQIAGKTVYNGDVMVNVAKNGQIVNVGGDSFPRLSITNAVTISPAQAIQNAAAALNVAGFSPQSLGSVQVLSTYGNLAPEFVTGEKFTRGGGFSDEIVVTQVIFPMGATARYAYKFSLTTPQYYGIMWQHFVDAQTGETLRRNSLTSFEKGHKSKKESAAKNDESGGQNLGTRGGGVGVGRLGTFRPDVQNMVEAMNNAGTARGKTIDGMPTMLSGFNGFGRSTRTETTPGTYVYTAPTYASDTLPLEGATGRGFRYGQANGRIEFPLPWNNDAIRPTFSHVQLPGLLGQITRGFPDAANPSAGSPFGWFYLPTDSGGAEITVKNTNRMTTRGLGYTMEANAVTKNQAFAGNSPNGDGLQPFSADITPLGSPVTLADGRVLSSVFQTRYTEGNNALITDDRANNDEAEQGIKGYALNRQFTAGYYDYYAGYEYGGPDATAGVFPTSTDADVPPATVSLFYYNNVLHDYLYSIGFSEQFWNFQMDNFGKGGAGGDFVSAQVMDGSGVNNANFSTPADGSMPRMQMYLFTEAQRRSDGDFDFEVIAHELYHGVSNRSAAKGGTLCLGITRVGESGGMGEGWGDFIASSMTDDDVTGEFVTGNLDRGIRRLPMTNYRWSYAAADHRTLDVRRTDPGVATTPDAQNPTSQTDPFAVHPIGELWSSTLWDMRELLIMKEKVNGTYPGVFFDGTRRLGSGNTFYVGDRQLQSKDLFHPINYRPEFNSTRAATPPNTLPVPNILPEHFVRPNMVALENQANPLRNGPLATAVSRAGRLADQLVLRGLQLAPCNPSFVEMRDEILAADREITGGENQAVIWRAFASHGVGAAARSTGGTGGLATVGAAQSAPVIVEDFTTPANVGVCETLGPLAEPAFTVTHSNLNTATITLTAVPGAASYVISRSTSADGPFATVATITGTTYQDNDNGTGLVKGQTYYYRVRSVRNAQCVGSAPTIKDVLIATGAIPNPAPVFAGLTQVTDLRQGTTLRLNWSPAFSGNPTAVIVYDIYRVASITTTANGQAESTTAPTFTPAPANRIAEGISGGCANGICAYTDTGRTPGQVYYYIVQARDTNNTKLDTNNTGNRIAKFSAPTTTDGRQEIFAIESFETGSANNRFVPSLTDSASADAANPVWQRVAAAELRGPEGTEATTAAMYAPNYDPGVPEPGQGGPSDIQTQIGPLTLSSNSILEFDSRFSTEFAFDGGNIEVKLGAPFVANDATPFPNNATTFDMNYFIIENGYTGKLDGTLAGPAMLSALQGRFSFSGTRATTHTRIALGSFAAGGANNSSGLPVYIRFRMTSDSGTSPGAGSGWYIDNLVINGFATAVAAGVECDVAGRPTGDGRYTAADPQQVERFLVFADSFDRPENEVQRADCSPYVSRGDGRLTSADVQQAERYLASADAMQNTGGPTSLTSGKTSDAIGGLFDKDGSASPQGLPRIVRAGSQNTVSGSTITVPILVNTDGTETGFSFTLDYNSAILSNPVIMNGDLGGTRLTTINPQGNANKITFSLRNFAGPNGTIAAVDNGVIVRVQFTVNATAQPGTTNLTFSGTPTANSVTNANAQELQASFNPGTVTIAAPRTVRATNRQTSAGAMISIPIMVDAVGDETGFSFTLDYDTTKLTNTGVTVGNVGGTLVTQMNPQGMMGKTTVSIRIFGGPNGTIPAGTNTLVNFQFTVNSNAPAGTTNLTFSGTPTANSVTNANAQELPSNFNPSTVTIAGPTAAPALVAGRVTNGSGLGLPNVLVNLLDAQSGARLSVVTDGEGGYRFEDVPVGGNYIVSPSSVGFTFNPRSKIFSLVEDLTTVDFVGTRNRKRKF